MTSIDIDDELAAALRARADAAGEPLDQFVRDLLADVMAAEGLDDSAQAEDFARNGMAIPGEDVVAWLRAGGEASGQPFPRARKIK